MANALILLSQSSGARSDTQHIYTVYVLASMTDIESVAKEFGFNPREMSEGALSSHRPAWEEIARLRASREWIRKWKPFLHECSEWDGLVIDKGDAEFECCSCFD